VRLRISDRRWLIVTALLTATIAADSTPALGSPYGYLHNPTDQLAVSGDVATTEVTPEGDLYTGWAELVFRFGPRLERWRQPTRTLTDGHLPVLSSSLESVGVRYELHTFTDTVAGVPVDFVRVTLRNLARHPVAARFGTALCWSASRHARFARPVTPRQPGLQTQPGPRFDPRWRYAIGSRTVRRSGSLLLAYPGAPRGAALRTRVRLGRGPVGPRSLFGATDYRIMIAPGRAAHLDFVMPVVAPAASSPTASAVAHASFTGHRAATLARWRHALTGAMRLEIPEAKVHEAFYASLVHMLEARYQLPDGHWVQTVNDLNYHAFWLRDTAVITQALDLAGLPTPAREDLEWFGAWQSPNGLFQSRVGQMDGLGQALWGIGEHVRMTHDLGFARAQLARVAAAMGWLERARAQDPLGLLPRSDPHDNELVAGHLAGDDFWGVAGANAAVGLARALGRDDLAARWTVDRDDLRLATIRGARAAAARHAGAIPPALDARGGLDWGNLWAAYPYPVLPPSDPLVTATLAHARRHFAEGIATYGRRRGLHGYLGFRTLETELARGDQRQVVDGLYAELAHTTATHAGFETGVGAWSDRTTSENLAPHGWFAAELVSLVRGMLVRERAGAIQLLGAVSRAWLAPGRRVGVAGAPTALGPVSFQLLGLRGGALLRWSAQVPRGTPIRWTVPADARQVRVEGRAVNSGLVTLPSTSGAMRITWRLPVGGPSFHTAVTSLQRGYRRRGLSPPLGG